MEDTAYGRGYLWGAHYGSIGYGKVNGHYPSNPYPKGSAEAIEYDKGYEIAASPRH